MTVNLSSYWPGSYWPNTYWAKDYWPKSDDPVEGQRGGSTPRRRRVLVREERLWTLEQLVQDLVSDSNREMDMRLWREAVAEAQALARGADEIASVAYETLLMLLEFGEALQQYRQEAAKLERVRRFNATNAAISRVSFAIGELREQVSVIAEVLHHRETNNRRAIALLFG